MNGRPITDGGPAVSVTNGSVQLVSGQLVFTPAANYHGPASFTYTITDGTVSAVATVNGTVTPVNDAPVASNDSFTVAEDDSVTVDVLSNDSDVDGNPLTITHVNGQAITAGGPAVSVTNGSVQLVSGQLVFTPAANYHGPASFTYTITDGYGLGRGDGQRHRDPGQRCTGRVRTTASRWQRMTRSQSMCSAMTAMLMVNSLTITHVNGQAITAGGPAVSVTNGSVQLVSGQLVFTPAANYHGPASFTYTITDGSVSAVATVSGTVTPVNDAPVASNDSFTVAEDDSVTVNVLGNDSDVDGNPLTITHVNGTAITAGGPAVCVTNGSVALVSGQLVFTPAANYHGPASSPIRSPTGRSLRRRRSRHGDAGQRRAGRV